MSLLVWDTETSGTSVWNDRIVSCFVGAMDDSGEFVQTWDWLIDIGQDIPAGATAVHGITNEKMRAEGRISRDALKEIGDAIYTMSIGASLPLTGYNVPFDLTLLQSEFRRHRLPEFPFDRLSVIDAFVIDKKLNPYRKGKRTLTVIAPTYGVSTDGAAHTADFDCLMTGRVALKQLEQLRAKGLNLKDQAAWKAEQSASLQAYFRKSDPAAYVNPGFPLQSPEFGVAA